MKILSIGNSFSQDAHKWLSQIARSTGQEIWCCNLYIGHCTLEKHWNNFLSGAVDYDVQINGESGRRGSINEALAAEQWDVITMQQSSGPSGLWDTYEPYLSDLFRQVKRLHPNAKYYMHQTWSYEIDSSHEAFVNYGRSQRRMYEQMRAAYEKASAALGIGVIPVGEVIQYLRENTAAFDYASGGLSLTRDGYHLSWLYGRYAAALTWYGVLTGKDVREVRFVPEHEGQQADKALLQAIGQAVYTVLESKQTR